MKLLDTIRIPVLGLLGTFLAAQVPQMPTQISLTLNAGSLVLDGPVPGTQAFAVHEAEGAPGSGFPFMAQAGSPRIVGRAIDLIVPPNCDLSTLRINHAWGPGGQGFVTALGAFDIAPNEIARTFDLDSNEEQTAIPPGVQLDAQGRNPSIYLQNAFWPPRPVVVRSTSTLRGMRSIRLLFAPFQWNPVTRQLRSVNSLPVTVSWSSQPINVRQWTRYAADPIVLDNLDQLFANPLDAGSWYRAPWVNVKDARFDYVIVTTDAVVSSSTELGNFRTLKQSQGHTVGVFTVAWIDDNYAGAERADRIRAFLRANYIGWGIRHVLLIGDPDPDDEWHVVDLVGSVPMKIAWPRGDGAETMGDGEACPTDHFYADLSDDWDVDGDGYSAAFDDDYVTRICMLDMGAVTIPTTYADYGVDFHSEVLVGRIPFDGVSDVDAVLDATIRYQELDLSTEPGIKSMRRRAFHAMSHFADDCDTSYLGRAIILDQTHPAGLTNTSLYEPNAAYSGDLQLQNGALIVKWIAQAAGLVTWTGHGNDLASKIRFDGTSLMNAGVAASLNDACRAFVIQGSCQNARPETSGNLAASLLREVAVGTYAGTRNSWYERNKTEFGDSCRIQDIVWWLAKGLVNDRSGGAALSDMRAAGFVDEATDEQNLLTYNFFGDPSGMYLYE